MRAGQTGALAVALLFAVAPLLVAAPAHAATTCPDYEFIGARGSGEDNTVPSAKRYDASDHGMGDIVGDVYRRIAKTVSDAGFTLTPYGVPYPAIGLDEISGAAALNGSAAPYLKSVELGAKAATAEIERAHASCPDTRLIVSGYSQGAQVMVDAIAATSEEARTSVLAAVFFGNTYFDAADNASDYSSYAPDLDGYLATGDSWATAFGDVPVFDYCHDGDPICGLVRTTEVGGTRYPVRDFAHVVASSTDAAGTTDVFAQHTNYARAGDTANAADQLRERMGLLRIRAAKAPPSARITADASAEAGTPVRLSAAGTLSDPTDPVVRYSWSLGDETRPGTVSRSTVDPVTTASYARPGSYTVTVTALTATGLSSSASLKLDVKAAPTTAPAAPKKVTAQAGDGEVTLSWPAVSGAAFYAVRDAKGVLLTAFTPIAGGQAPVSWTDTGLKNGAERHYRVYAVNSAGSSDGSAEQTTTPQARATSAPLPAAMAAPRSEDVDPELAWALGLGLIACATAVALASSRRR